MFAKTVCQITSGRGSTGISEFFSFQLNAITMNLMEHINAGTCADDFFVTFFLKIKVIVNVRLHFTS